MMEENKVLDKTRACINTKDNQLFLSIYTVNEDSKLTGNEETLWLGTENSGYYKVVSKVHGTANINYFGNYVSDRIGSYHYRPEIDFEKRELVPEDFKKIQENKALVDPVDGKNLSQVEEYMRNKIENLEKSGIKVTRITP